MRSGPVTLDVLFLEISKKVSSVTYHLQKSAPGVIVLGVALEVLVKIVDPVGKDGDLDLGRACVSLMDGVLVDDCLLFFLKHD